MSQPIDQSFVEYVVKSLVENPDAVSVERTVDDRGVLLLLTVDPEDLGRVIGKRGATAQSIRTLLRGLGNKNGERLNLKIVDNGPDDYAGSREESAPAPAENAEVATEEEVEESQPEEVAASEDLMEKHRKDLEDLDDLDI